MSINVNVYVYSMIYSWVQQASQFTPLVLTLLFYSLISSGENLALMHFNAGLANHYNLAFLFQKAAIIAELTEVAWYERLSQHLYTRPAVWLEHGHLPKY